jgi:hypothetical protein
MTNHVYVLMTPHQPNSIAKVMQALGRRYVPPSINAMQGEEVPVSTFTKEEVASKATRDGEGVLLRDTLAILICSC